MTQEDGQYLIANAAGQTASVSTVPVSNTSGYTYLDGTSMATPHVSGVAAIVWSADPTASKTALRSALESTALDLGAAGRDNQYGHGLVQALTAADVLTGGVGTTAPSGLEATNNGTAKGKLQVALAWSGGATTVDVYRDGVKVKSAIANGGGTTDAVKVRRTGTLSYQVCNAGGSSCSAPASVNY